MKISEIERIRTDDKKVWDAANKRGRPKQEKAEVDQLQQVKDIRKQAGLD